MFSLENRVNGVLINFTYVHNEELIDDSGGTCVYYVEHHRINQKPKIIDFRVKHKRYEGAEKLALLIYQEIDKRLNNVKSPKKKK